MKSVEKGRLRCSRHTTLPTSKATDIFCRFLQGGDEGEPSDPMTDDCVGSFIKVI